MVEQEELKKKEILFYFLAEKEFKNKIEELMNFEIPMVDFLKQVEISLELIDEEKADFILNKMKTVTQKKIELTAGFHEKKEKNLKTNLGGSYMKSY